MPPKPAPKAAARGRGAPARGTGSSRGGATRGRGAGQAKSGSNSPAAAKSKTPAAPAASKWTEKDDAAVKIQRVVRSFLAKRRLLRKKQEKEKYEAEMDRLEKEAFVQIVRMQQEEADRQRQKEDEERRRIAEYNKRKKRMLEAAFDGDKNQILAILKEVSDIDTKNELGNDVIGKALRNRHQMEMVCCEDPNGNTPVSEAASGGDDEVIKLLLERGAEINSQGQFKRTPLYRASFAGHLSACEVLLQNGADPRIYAEDAQTPLDVSSVGSVKELLTNWDISQTERLLEKIERDKAARVAENSKRIEAEIDNIQDKLKTAQKDYESQQKKLNKAYEELNKRIYEHDMATASGFERTDITEGTIHDAEMELECAKLDFDKARDHLSRVKLDLREKQKEEGMAAGEKEQQRPGIECPLRELDDVLFRDVGNRIKETGKWPVVVDPSGQASTFLRYRDTNYFNSLNPNCMEPEKLRMGLLGCLRYGKPFVLDMMEVDMFPTCADRFDMISKGLMASILDKSILQRDRYLKLIKATDGEDYNQNKFMESRVQAFQFFLVVKNPYPSDEVLDTFSPVWIIIAGKK